MFTGIIQDKGKVLKLDEFDETLVIKIRSKLDESNFTRGNSIAVNGVCLTVERFKDACFTCTVVQETLKKTNLAQLQVGMFVNLEPSLTLSTPLAGHFVSGHVDCSAKILSSGSEMKISVLEEFVRFLPSKGSVSINGVSLTIAEQENDWIRIALIPETLAMTNLGEINPGDLVNIEVDLLARYLDKLNSK